MAGEALLQTRLGGGIRSRYHSGGRAEPSGLMDTPPQGALPRFGGFGLCRPAADVQLGAGGTDFPVLGKTLEETLEALLERRRKGRWIRIYAWADTYVRVAPHIYTCSLTRTSA